MWRRHPQWYTKSRGNSSTITIGLVSHDTLYRFWLTLLNLGITWNIPPTPPPHPQPPTPPPHPHPTPNPHPPFTQHVRHCIMCQYLIRHWWSFSLGWRRGMAEIIFLPMPIPKSLLTYYWLDHSAHTPKNTMILISENDLENVLCPMTAILLKSLNVNGMETTKFYQHLHWLGVGMSLCVENEIRCDLCSHSVLLAARLLGCQYIPEPSGDGNLISTLLDKYRSSCSGVTLLSGVKWYAYHRVAPYCLYHLLWSYHSEAIQLCSDAIS